MVLIRCQVGLRVSHPISTVVATLFMLLSHESSVFPTNMFYFSLTFSLTFLAFFFPSHNFLNY